MSQFIRSPTEASQSSPNYRFADDSNGDRVSDFVLRLHRLLEENQFPQIISWSPSRESFVIKNVDLFARLVLLPVFKHQNFTSFVRQLHKYSFHKVKLPNSNPDFHEYAHEHFRARDTVSLKRVQRKPEVRRPSESDAAMQAQLASVTAAQAATIENARRLDAALDSMAGQVTALRNLAETQAGMLASLSVQPTKPTWQSVPSILVVDDDSVCLNFVCRVLEQAGCNTFMAHDGVEALELIRTHKYDLVLMDIVMPRLDGATAAAHVRSFDSRTPIVSLTSYTAPDDIARYASQGISDVLSKPFGAAGLMNMIEKHLSHLRSRTPYFYQSQSTAVASY